MRPMDTSPEAYRVQMAAFANMSASQRVRMAMQLSEDMVALTADGVRKRHPDYDERQVRWAVDRMRLGDDLFRAVWPDAPLVSP